MRADHDRSSTPALNRGNTGIGSDRKMNLAHSNTANLLTSAAVARKQTEAVIHKRRTGAGSGEGRIRTPLTQTGTTAVPVANLIRLAISCESGEASAR